MTRCFFVFVYVLSLKFEIVSEYFLLSRKFENPLERSMPGGEQSPANYFSPEFKFVVESR